MVMLRYLLLFVEIVTSALLLLAILAQKSKSQGLGMAFGSGMGESLFGSQMGNVLTRITVWLAIIFLANTTVLGIVNAHISRRMKAIQAGLVETPLSHPTVPESPVQPPEGAGMPPQGPLSPVGGEMPEGRPIVEGVPGAVETVPAIPPGDANVGTPAAPMPETPVAVQPAAPTPAAPVPAPAPEMPKPETK